MKTRKLDFQTGCKVIQARGFACIDRFKNSSYVVLHHMVDGLVG